MEKEDADFYEYSKGRMLAIAPYGLHRRPLSARPDALAQVREERDMTYRHTVVTNTQTPQDPKPSTRSNTSAHASTSKRMSEAQRRRKVADLVKQVAINERRIAAMKSRATTAAGRQQQTADEQAGEAMDRAMGIQPRVAAVRREQHRLTFEAITPTEAAKRYGRKS